MMNVDYRRLLLQLLPTFLRVGVLRAFCNAVATVLQRHCNSVATALQAKKEMIVWTSERKAMRERLNLLYRGVSYNVGDEFAILVEDGYDVQYQIAWNNDEFDDGVPADKRLMLTTTENFTDAIIFNSIEDLGVGCNLSVVIPTDSTGNLSIVYGNLMGLKKEVNRLVFAGLLCKFYKLTKEGNNIIKTEI